MKTQTKHSRLCLWATKTSILRLAHLYFLFFISVGAAGQDKHKVDSLEQVLLDTCDDHSKIEVLFQLTKQFFENDNKRALMYAERAKNLAIKFDDSLQYVKMFRVYGILLLCNGRIAEAINVLKTIEPIAIRHGFNVEYEKVTNYLGLCYVDRADFPSALKYYFKSMDLREEANDKEGISIILNNIGVIYMEASNHKKALEYFHRSMEIKNEINDRYDLSKLLVNIGLCYVALHDQEKARDFVMRGLRSCDGICSGVIQSQAWKAYAQTFENDSRYDSAKKYYQRSYQLAKQVGDVRLEIYSLLGIGRINRFQGNLQNAMKYFCTVDSLDKKCQYSALVADAYSELGDYFFETKNFKRAEDYNRRYKVLQDTLYRRSLKMTVAMGEAEAERREGAIKIDSQKKVIALNEKVIAVQRRINFIAGIAGFLTIGFICLLSFNIHQRKNVNALLEARVKERTKELESSYDSLRRTSEERNQALARVARELKEPLLSLQGINAVAQREVADPKAQDYFQRTDAIVHQLLDAVSRFTS